MRAPLVWTASLVAAASLGFAAACSSAANGPSPNMPTATDAGVIVDNSDPFDQPIDGLSSDLLTQFNDGDLEFALVLRSFDGLGPLYTRASCDGCHRGGARGPGLIQKMVVVEPDGITPSPDQSALPFGNTEHPLLITDIPGVKTPILPPQADAGLGVDGGTGSVRVTVRLGPPVLGRGYMEAIADSEILRVETEQAGRADGIHGRANHTTFASEANPDSTFDSYKKGDPVIGRFGLKARVATLDDFVADAAQGDMGMTSAMRPSEFANPDGVIDDLKPGIDLATDKLNARASYLRLLAIPKRTPNEGGEALLDGAKCTVCHVRSLHTRADYPVPQLADIDAPVYSDLLLHDMGDDLADSVAGGNEGQAGPRDWRTAPLIGLRFNRVLMHDGRAATVEEAIAKHAGNGSEANDSVGLFNALSAGDRQALLDYVNGL